MLDADSDPQTLPALLAHWAAIAPEADWLIERHGDASTRWNWRTAQAEVLAVGAWLESVHGANGSSMAILSRNRAHWVLADLAIIASGNVTVPLFTTQNAETTSYILDFAEVSVLFLGEAENWARIREIVPAHVAIVALPGLEEARAGHTWNTVCADHRGKAPGHACARGDLMSIVFTSGTTGVPKGVMQTHDSMLTPMRRAGRSFVGRGESRFLSYLPLPHVAERQLVETQSLIHGGSIRFMESPATLVRDMAETRPTFFFGAPRVWEQLQQGVLARFGGHEGFERAFATNPEGVGHAVREALGLQDPVYLLTAAAPTPAALIHWYERLGIELMEGFGQTEAMALIANERGARRVGSIGRALPDVEVRISEEGELLCRAEGLSPGYYRMPEQTAATFVDGWVHTGDRARVDEDGYYYITGRVKEYFKTIQGKFVSPVPIESAFAASPLVAQQCLLGRGFAKTVMLCVPSEDSRSMPAAELEQALGELVLGVNAAVEKHARIGAVILCDEPWTIENGTLTPTLKLRREQLEARFGERAEALARQAAEAGRVLVGR